MLFYSTKALSCRGREKTKSGCGNEGADEKATNNRIDGVFACKQYKHWIAEEIKEGGKGHEQWRKREPCNLDIETASNQRNWITKPREKNRREEQKGRKNPKIVLSQMDHLFGQQRGNFFATAKFN